jgi:hypothetical protein
MSQRAMQGGPAPFRPFEGPLGAPLRQQWENLHDKTGGLRKPDQRTADAASMPTIVRTQGTFSRQMTGTTTTCCWHLPTRPLAPARGRSLCVPGVCCMAHVPAHGASIEAEGCRVLLRHAAPTRHLATALRHGRASMPVAYIHTCIHT